VAFGRDGSGRCQLPALVGNLFYTQAAAGGAHSVLLVDDGTAVACGWNVDGQCDLPGLAGGLTYTQVAAAGSHSVLLRSDGTAVACGSNGFRQCSLPALSGGLVYTQVAAGSGHTALLKSDGTAVACGWHRIAACGIPAVAGSRPYTHVAAGCLCTVLLTRDSMVLSFGPNVALVEFPALMGNLTYVANLLPCLVMQASFDGNSIILSTLAGVQRGAIPAGPTDRIGDIYYHLMAHHRAGRLGAGIGRVDLLLPGGGLLRDAPAGGTIASAFGLRRLRLRGKRPRAAYAASVAAP